MLQNLRRLEYGRLYVAFIIDGAAVLRLVQRRSTSCAAEKFGFDSHQGQEISIYSKTSKIVLGRTELLINLALGEKWPGREANHSSPSIVDVKNVWSYK
jgi:hypothetical protein